MRNSVVIKKALPVTLVLAMTLHGNVAHAGMLDGFKKIFSSFFSGSQTPAQNAAAAVDPSEVKKQKYDAATFSVEEDFVKKSIAFTDTLNKFYTTELRLASRAKSEKLDHINTETHTRLVPEYTAEGLVFKVQYDDVALQNPKMLLKDLATLDMIVAGRASSAGIDFATHAFTGRISEQIRDEIISPHAAAELLRNVLQGSPTAKARWNDLQVSLLENAQIKTEISTVLKLESSAMTDVLVNLKAQSDALNQEAAAFARKQQKSIDKWRSETGALDKYEAMNEKLDDLILNNDRKGVRQMLEAYLPWAVMEPVEANTWKVWLDAIENPNHEKTTVAFRGLSYDTDKIQRRQTAQGEIFGFMSTVLTKNQGSYTRRLRSLSTNREKNGDIGFKVHGENIRSTKMTDQMTAHARNPVASSFMSFTYAPGVAKGFMGADKIKVVDGQNVTVPSGGMLVVKMDSRRMIPNVPSMYKNEIELLVPLIVFPDEVVAYKEGRFNGNGEYIEFVSGISAKTGINFGAMDNGTVDLQKRYTNDGHDFLKTMLDIKLSAQSCRTIFAD